MIEVKKLINNEKNRRCVRQLLGVANLNDAMAAESERDKRVQFHALSGLEQSNSRSNYKYNFSISYS